MDKIADDSDFLKEYLVENEINDDIKDRINILLPLYEDNYKNLDYYQIIPAFEYLEINKNDVARCS